MYEISSSFILSSGHLSIFPLPGPSGRRGRPAGKIKSLTNIKSRGRGKGGMGVEEEGMQKSARSTARIIQKEDGGGRKERNPFSPANKKTRKKDRVKRAQVRLPDLACVLQFGTCETINQMTQFRPKVISSSLLPIVLCV